MHVVWETSLPASWLLRSTALSKLPSSTALSKAFSKPLCSMEQGDKLLSVPQGVPSHCEYQSCSYKHPKGSPLGACQNVLASQTEHKLCYAWLITFSACLPCSVPLSCGLGSRYFLSSAHCCLVLADSPSASLEQKVEHHVHTAELLKTLTKLVKSFTSTCELHLEWMPHQQCAPHGG